jgi:NO-binding membrane sensor protein with MHYT domain
MPHEMHHFYLGLWVLFLAYVTSIVGSFIGLSCVRRTTGHPPGRSRRGWPAMAALAIGGVGIWMTHFIAMMGFAVPGTIIRYDPTVTTLSAILAVVATGFGLWLTELKVLAGRPLLGTAALLVGGVVMGLAVSLMHYSGMAAIRIRGELSHDPMFVAGSIAIGIAASTAALWLARAATGRLTRLLGALVMAGAVAALHYTGMAGVQVTLDPTAPAPEGVTIMELMLPAFVLGTIVLAVPLAALLLTHHSTDSAVDDAIATWTSQIAGADPALGDRDHALGSAPGSGRRHSGGGAARALPHAQSR